MLTRMKISTPEKEGLPLCTARKYTDELLATPVIVEITPRNEKNEKKASSIASRRRRIGL